MDQKIFQKAYGKLVAKAWSDTDFKAELLLDPGKVFMENEIKIPDGALRCYYYNLDKSHEYYWRVVAIDSFGNESMSEIVRFYTN